MYIYIYVYTYIYIYIYVYKYITSLLFVACCQGMGYAFVNFKVPEHAAAFLSAFQEYIKSNNK